MIETRQEEGLHVLLNAAFILVEDGTLSEEDMARLKNTLSDLREEAKYSSILLNSRPGQPIGRSSENVACKVVGLSALEAAANGGRQAVSLPRVR